MALINIDFMGVCASNSCDRSKVISAIQAPIRLGKQQKELAEVIESDRGKVNSRVTELYENAVGNPLSITAINLNLIHLGGKSCEHLSNLLHICPNVSVLKLWKCHIGVKGIEFLSNTIRDLRQLEVLYLDGNDLGTEGAKHLAACLPHLSNLRELHCRSNALECEGVSVMSEMMGYLVNLTVLTLDDNDITSVGLEALLTNLELSKLEKFGLSYDRITDYGGYCLIKCAGKLQNLRTLEFKGNLVNALVAEKMMRTFRNVAIE